MPSAGQLPTEVQLAGVAGVILDNQHQVSFLAAWVLGRWDIQYEYRRVQYEHCRVERNTKPGKTTPE
jgi:hypothetical protein